MQGALEHSFAASDFTMTVLSLDIVNGPLGDLTDATSTILAVLGTILVAILDILAIIL